MLLKEDVVMRLVNFAPYSRASIGFDRLFDMLENFAQTDQAANYPPYNIARTGDDAYRITLAVAGFTPDELTITSEPNELRVAGTKAGKGDAEYLYEGFANRDFEHRFGLADYVKVAGASLNNGVLSIDLIREIPEAMKPRR